MSLVLYDPPHEPDRYLPEGPRHIALGGRDAVFWANIQDGPDALEGSLFAYYFDTGEVHRWRPPGRPGFALPAITPGVVLLGMDHAIGTFDLLSSTWTPLATIPDPNPRTMINDAEVTPGGGVIFGTKDRQFRDPIAALYYFDPLEHRIIELRGGQTCSNGKVFRETPDGGWRLWDIDTPTKAVAAYDWFEHEPRLEPAETVVDLTAEDAFPDGMCDAGDGGLIIGFYNPHRGGTGCAKRYSNAGEFIEEWETAGSPRVTCPRLMAGRLILTTATEGMEPEKRATSPNAGCLFAAETTLPAPPQRAVRI